jgi:uncharacterized protein (DUF697 family)
MHPIFEKLFAAINPEQNPDLHTASDQWQESLPTLWLLGKTGAGKSSLIQALTGDTRVDIGNGFRPCTLSSSSYDFPLNRPLIRFLDTRGLAEADYDPAEDLAACQGRSHALLVVARADDPEQSDLSAALKRIRRATGPHHILLVHTGILLPGDEREQAIAHNQAQLEKAWGEKLTAVAVDTLPDSGDAIGLEELRDALQTLLPMVAELIQSDAHQTREQANFSTLKREVLWYAGVAAASDLAPAVGMVSVPTVQAKMLHSLAQQYDVDWNRQSFAEFAGVLGSGFALQYGSRLGIRQLVKFIPAYGQTVGSASAAAISFTTTFALGRVAAKYLYHNSRGESVSREELKALYGEAMKVMNEVAGRD